MDGGGKMEVIGWLGILCMEEHRLKLPPGIASTMLRSSPSSCCHFRQEVQVWERGMEARMSWRRARRCGGSSTVRFTVLMVQPSMLFLVAHAASPLNSYLMEIGSLRCLVLFASATVCRASLLCFRLVCSPLQSAIFLSLLC
jgi:hypothetical protein